MTDQKYHSYLLYRLERKKKLFFIFHSTKHTLLADPEPVL